MRDRLHPFVRHTPDINPMCSNPQLSQAEINRVLWQCLNKSLEGTPQDIVTVIEFCASNELDPHEVLPELAAYRHDPPERLQ